MSVNCQIVYHNGVMDCPADSAPRATRRIRWLAEVAAALDAAGALAVRLSDLSAGYGETVAVRGQIAALRSEVDSIRRGGRQGWKSVSPERMY